MKIDRPVWAISAYAAALAMVVTSCGSSTTPAAEETTTTSAAEEPVTVSAADLADAVVGQLDEPRPVSCPDGLVADVGSSVDCTLQLSEVDAIDVRVTVTDVDPDKAGTFDFELSSLFTTEQLQTQVQKWVSQQDPGAAAIECPSGLEGSVGASTTCTVQTSDGQEVAIKTTVDDAGPASISMSFETV